MVKTFYLMRHGQTRFNVQGRIQGACDSPLTDEGIEQAKAARRYFEQEGISFKAIQITDRKTAQAAPTPITTYAFFYNGDYVTNEQMNDKKFLKLVSKVEG